MKNSQYFLKLSKRKKYRVIYFKRQISLYFQKNARSINYVNSPIRLAALQNPHKKIIKLMQAVSEIIEAFLN